jgi:lipoprotein-releasing system permease protein
MSGSWQAALLIARRWFLLKQHWGIARLIFWFSVLGISIGVSALTIVSSIFKGLHDSIYAVLLEQEPHLLLLPEQGRALREIGTLDSLLRHLPEVRLSVPVLSERVVVARQGALAPALFTAAAESLLQRSTLQQGILLGEPMLRAQRAVLLGAALADRLRALPGDTVELLTPAALERLALGIPTGRAASAVVVGIVRPGVVEQSSFAVYADTVFGRTLIDLPPGSYSAVQVWLHDIKYTDAVATSLRQKLARHGVIIQPWRERHRQLYDVLRLERLGTTLVLALIVLVATFGVTASLVMGVVQKQRDIGILRALGISAREVQRIYLLQGIGVGAIGTVLGALLGGLFYWGQRRYGWLRLDPSRYILSQVPVELSAWDIATIGLIAFMLAIVAALYPAARAARLHPAAVLREE